MTALRESLRRVMSPSRLITRAGRLIRRKLMGDWRTDRQPRQLLNVAREITVLGLKAIDQQIAAIQRSDDSHWPSSVSVFRSTGAMFIVFR